MRQIKNMTDLIRNGQSAPAIPNFPVAIDYPAALALRQIHDGAQGRSPVLLQPGSGLSGITVSPLLEELVTAYDLSSNKPFHS